MTTTQSGKTIRKTSTAKTKTPAPPSAEPTIQNNGETQTIPQEDWRDMVATAAYYRAQARGFQAGSPEQDWLAAEDELKQRLQQTGSSKQ